MAKARRPALLRLFRNLAEAAVLHSAFFLVRLLPVEAASNLGGWLGRRLGPRLGLTRRARRSLKIAFPDWSQERIETTVIDMWDNLGRVAFEYPHLDTICHPDSGRLEVQGFENVATLRGKTKAGLIISAHLANWEVSQVAAGLYGIDITAVVRLPNNPLTKSLLERTRSVGGGRRIGKGSDGAKEALRTLQQNGVLAMLVDQKLNDGIAVEFFGHKAMTAAAPAQMALKFRCPVIPVRTERLGPGRFRVSCQTPLELPNSGDRHADIATLTLQINAIVENWIRERPAEWLWLHRRWPKELYRAAAVRAER